LVPLVKDQQKKFEITFFFLLVKDFGSLPARLVRHPRTALHLASLAVSSIQTMAVDSALTPPLSAEAKQLKKDAKKAAKLLRRAAEAQSKADEAAAEAAEELVAVVGEKRKAGEDGEVKKVKKSKKNKDVAVEPTASTSTIPIVAATPAQVTTFLEENRIQHEPETAASSYPAVLSFAALPIEAGLRTGLAGYTTPTPIQCASFPVTMGGRDVIGIAETGYVDHIASFPYLLPNSDLPGTTDLERR
jgi:alkylation response protein AidB-like acyl-CoA dehydrogenase